MNDVENVPGDKNDGLRVLSTSVRLEVSLVMSQYPIPSLSKPHSIPCPLCAVGRALVSNKCCGSTGAIVAVALLKCSCVGLSLPLN